MRTDADLLRSFEPEAFAEFYERHAQAVTAYLARRADQPDVLFDLLGETFARAYEHRRQHDPRRGPAVAWLLNTARYVLAEAERRGEVPDGARRRIGLEPIVLSDAGLEAVGARRTDLREALAGLPESQRLAVQRRLLGEDEYEPVRQAALRPSPLVLRDGELKRGRDPYDLLGERLFLAAGGQLERSKGRLIAIAAVLVMLLGAGAAWAALRVAGDEDPEPTPTPAVTPAVPDPTTTPPPTSGGGAMPAPEADIDLQLVPDLRAGRVGWCVELRIRSQGLVTGDRGCTPAGRAGQMIISTGGTGGTPGAGYAIVDAAVAEIRLDDGRRVTPEADPDLPAGWRSASWTVNGALPRFTLHDFAGNELPPFRSAPLDPLPARRQRAADRRRCAIRAEGLRASSARIVRGTVGAQDAIDPSYVACASTVLRIGGARLRTAVLLDARSPAAIAPDLPSVGETVSVRREGRGLLVVDGGTEAQRARVLDAVRVREP